jgi:hypothetical protein
MLRESWLGKLEYRRVDNEEGSGRWEMGNGRWEWQRRKAGRGDRRGNRKQGTGNKGREEWDVCDGEQLTKRFSLDRFPFARTKVLRLSIY